MKAAIRKSMQRLGLGEMATRLLDEMRKTVDVTPPPHIAPCGMSVPGARLAAATRKPCGQIASKPSKSRAARKADEKSRREAEASADYAQQTSRAASNHPFKKFFRDKSR